MVGEGFPVILILRSGCELASRPRRVGSVTLRSQRGHLLNPVTEFIFLLAAGFGAGLIGFVTGLASVVSYPALLAVGLSPVAANVTNTVSVVAVGIGSTSRREGAVRR